MADAQAPKEKWKMARYRPNMDFAKVMFIFVWYSFENMLKYQAKNVIGLPSGAKAEELEHEEIHKQFITKLAQVTPLFRRTLKICLNEGFLAQLQSGSEASPWSLSVAG